MQGPSVADVGERWWVPSLGGTTGLQSKYQNIRDLQDADPNYAPPEGINRIVSGTFSIAPAGVTQWFIQGIGDDVHAPNDIVIGFPLHSQAGVVAYIGQEVRNHAPGVAISQLEDLPQSEPTVCFISGTAIDMWPKNSTIWPNLDGQYDEALVLSKVWKKPIEEITADDVVLSYDNEGNLKPGRVRRTFRNTATHILDFWGTGVTLGHAYFCAEGRYKGEHVPIMDILRTDGAIVNGEGDVIRAATGCKVGSVDDRMIHAFAGEIPSGKSAYGPIRVKESGQIRLGTRIMLENGRDISLMDLIVANGGKVTDDGYIRLSEDGRPRQLCWTFSERLPRPEDFILQRSGVELESIYRAGEWESIATRLSGPTDGLDADALNGSGALPQGSTPSANLPAAFTSHPEAPLLKPAPGVPDRVDREERGDRQDRAIAY